MHKAKVEESWGDGTPGWKINANEVAPFTRLESYGLRPYANIKTERAHDPYLEVNNIFGRNHDTSNAQHNQRHEECRDDPTLEPSVCKIRRFEMTPYLPRDSTRSGATGEWFKKDRIGSVITWDDLVEKFVQKFYRLFDHNDEIEEDDNLDDITDIFKIEGNLFDFETPLCEAFNDFNYLLKIDKDLFTFDIQRTGTYKEYELNNPMTRDLEEPWLDNGVPYQLCDHICEPYHFKNGVTKSPICSLNIDECCNGEELPWMVRVESMTNFQDHKCFRNFQELDYNVLVNLQECWYKINANEVAQFTRLESYGLRPYANIKTERAHDPYLEVNNIFGRNHDTSNAQDNQGHEERRADPTLEPSVCKIRRFEMMKYSFNVDEEYIVIKESEYLNHSKDSLDAYQELLHIIDKGLVVATPDEEK
uniref:Uncharacterized protein n=1 Tax=Tanacetum cinerariifolium TaxID=118510 RepID=A0A6L2JBF6_TANCI|nr:hypothetical protein [Tanacetum cinerariifolium]